MNTQRHCGMAWLSGFQMRGILATSLGAILTITTLGGISSVTVSPDPLVVGEPFTVSVEGTDISRGMVTVDFRPTATRMMRLSLAAAESAWLAQGQIPDDLDLTGPVTVRVTAFGFGATGARSSSVKDVTLIPAPTTVDVTVQGRVLFTDGSPVVGAAVSGESFEDGLRAAIAEVWQVTPEADRGSPRSAEAKVHLHRTAAEHRKAALGGLMSARPQVAAVAGAVTDGEGRFELQVVAPSLPARVTVRVSYEETGLPAVQSGITRTTEAAALDVGVLELPIPAETEMTVTGNEARNDDGTIVISNLPPEVERVFSQSFDPDEDPEAFPGEFAELGRVPLNSSLFLWIEALDADGNAVDNLSQAVTIRSLVPPSQWVDLEDIQSGTGRIEIPIYTFNETTGMWEDQGSGWLEDQDGTVLPEEVEPLIVGGTFSGDIYAVLMTTHFSWMNVDYPYIGPWTLSRIPVERRNDDCLYNAMQLAKTIARSAAGRATYMKFNVAGGDLDVELADGAGPELKAADLPNAYGEFKGNEKGDRDDQLYLNNSLWAGCQAGATDAQKKNTTLMMAVTLLHETAHWKWDTKHDGGNWTNREPGGEAGNELEKDLFGGIITGGPGGIERDGVAVDDATRDGWLNGASWPAPRGVAPGGSGTLLAAAPSPLEMTISVPKTTYDLGEEIRVTVEYRNAGTDPIKVLTLNALEGYPLAFEIIRQGAAERVPFRGERLKRFIDYDAMFATLQVGETLSIEIQLLVDPDTGGRRYNVTQSGVYDLTAFYSSHYGLPETMSNPLTITIGGGGRLQGNVNNATTTQGIAGATVKVIEGTTEVAQTTTDASGNYEFPELAPGTYSMEASALGFLTATRNGVVVTAGQTTIANFSLSSLVASGQMRIVLTWGASPSDLDSHLWLPPDKPYHVAYYRRGTIDGCPFANLDVDDTSGFGPETITIAQRLPGRYDYAVHLYCCGSTMAGTGAQVQVFDESGLIATFIAPATGSGDWWHVMAIDGGSGGITEINQVRDNPGLYDDDSGCPCPPDWVHDVGTSICTFPCPPGQIHVSEFSDCVFPCPEGSIHDADLSECVPFECPPGTFHDGVASACYSWCPPDMYHDGGDSNCTPFCTDPGTFHDGVGSDCIPFCSEPGTTHDGFESACVPFCAPGWVHDGGLSNCSWSGECPPEMLHDGETTACACPEGSFHEALTSSCVAPAE